mgnify:CR=1 FL=1
MLVSLSGASAAWARCLAPPAVSRARSSWCSRRAGWLSRVDGVSPGRAARVYGIGSSTDSARYRLALAIHHRVPVAAVRGWVIGEHGDGAVICASTTTVNGRAADVPLKYVRA